MEIAKREFDIPIVLEPDYLASPYLDELSGMTYLSYFMKEGSPGFHATLRWVNSQLSHTSIRNFTVGAAARRGPLSFSPRYSNGTSYSQSFRLSFPSRRIGTTVGRCAESYGTWAVRRRPTTSSTRTLPRGSTTYKWVGSPHAYATRIK